jgi:hypothetical protein
LTIGRNAQREGEHGPEQSNGVTTASKLKIRNITQNNAHAARPLSALLEIDVIRGEDADLVATKRFACQIKRVGFSMALACERWQRPYQGTSR